MKRLIILASILFTVLAFSTAHAYHHNCGMLNSKLSDMDENKDGSINYDEFTKYYASNVKAIFDALDFDKDGSISNDEWTKFLEVHGYSADGKPLKKG